MIFNEGGRKNANGYLQRRSSMQSLSGQDCMERSMTGQFV
ncbi:hypothetical protein BRYFOR_05288 [Marvinbryantia formatexigens DSM 14469]|uniref:Uncharacterized protein n=1 Tax=Marvinbryantia formatexigens DSM 14469 TaxID=478749 RepID=C6L9J8_9FIRM|nr:hypothetical protein BRYFOR_05288 [Marvinbryantia formatexigens DSM 14469]